MRLWCPELPALPEFVPGPLVMVGEQWMASGAHRYLVRGPLAAASPFAALEAAARRHGGQTEWNNNAGWMNLSGPGWKGMASIGGGPKMALGEYLDLMVEFSADPIHAEQAARTLARQIPVLAPFVDLADAHGARFEVASRREFEGAIFGYMKFGAPGLETAISQSLDALAASPAVLTRSADSLRVDINGLSEFESRPAFASPPGPPRADDVFARAQCLVALFDRLSFERAGKAADRGTLDQFNVSLVKWLERERLYPALTDTERQLLQAPVGAWNKPTYLNVSWWMEAAGTLAWALGYLESLPPAQVDVNTFQDRFPTLEPIYARVSQARLRPLETIQAAHAAIAAQQAAVGTEAWSIASERSRALGWICGVRPWE